MRKRIVATSQRGGALVEFALTLPLLFMLILNVVNFGGMLYAWIVVSNAVRAGADYMVLSSASTGGPVLTTDANTTALINKDLHVLPDSATAVTITICTKYTSPTCTPPTDPENAASGCSSGTAICYTDGSVDVTYTYTPFIAVGYKVLGIPLTLPRTSIHRKAVARILQ